MISQEPKEKPGIRPYQHACLKSMMIGRGYASRVQVYVRDADSEVAMRIHAYFVESLPWLDDDEFVALIERISQA